MKTLKAEMKQSADGGWYWHLKAGNNKIVLVSEVYTRRRDCIRAMNVVARMATSTSYWNTYVSPMTAALQSAIYNAGMKP